MKLLTSITKKEIEMNTFLNKHLFKLVSGAFIVICMCCGFVIKQEVAHAKMQEWKVNHVRETCELQKKIDNKLYHIEKKIDKMNDEIDKIDKLLVKTTTILETLQKKNP